MYTQHWLYFIFLQLSDVIDNVRVNEFVANFTLQTFGDNHRIGQTLTNSVVNF
jgi:hypothetical protein